MAAKPIPLADLDVETWRAIAHPPGYEVSSIGRVRSMDRTLPDGRFWRGMVMSLKTTKLGYREIALARGGGKYRHAFVHTLVAEAFHGPKPTPKHQVAHFDGDRLNNRAANVRWATSLENARDRDRHGKTFRPRGDLHPNAKLTSRSVASLRQMKAAGLASAGELAAMFGVSKSTVFNVAAGRSWGSL